MMLIYLMALCLCWAVPARTELETSPYTFWHPTPTKIPPETISVNYSNYDSQETRSPSFPMLLSSTYRPENQPRRVVDRRPQLPFITERYSPPGTNPQKQPSYPPPYPSINYNAYRRPVPPHPYRKPEFPDKSYPSYEKRPQKPLKEKSEWSWSRFKPYIRRPPASIDKIIDGGLLLGFIPIRSVVSVAAVWSLVYWQLSRTTTPVVRLRSAGDDEATIFKKDAKLWLDLLLQTWLHAGESWNHEECLKRSLCEIGQDYLQGVTVPTWIDHSVKSVLARKIWMEGEDFWDAVTHKDTEECGQRYAHCPWSLKKLLLRDGMETDTTDSGLA